MLRTDLLGLRSRQRATCANKMSCYNIALGFNILAGEAGI